MLALILAVEDSIWGPYPKTTDICLLIALVVAVIAIFTAESVWAPRAGWRINLFAVALVFTILGLIAMT